MDTRLIYKQDVSFLSSCDFASLLILCFSCTEICPTCIVKDAYKLLSRVGDQSLDCGSMGRRNRLD
jgi:hypothetical protein